MKIKLTPAMCYLLGLWRSKKSTKGFGIRGRKGVAAFVEESIKQGITEKGKVLYDGSEVFFYNSKFLKFAQEFESEIDKRLKYLNDYAANYFAGVFDGTGKITEDGKVLIRKDPIDQGILLRLGFFTRPVGKDLMVLKPKNFLEFISKWRRCNEAEANKEPKKEMG
ncbi:MAG: hypothetical protein QW035_01080 [Candidatus Anstonellales archaeon]